MKCFYLPWYFRMVEWWLLRRYCLAFPVLWFYYMHDSANVVS